MKTNKWIYTAVLGLLFASCQSVETPMFSDANDTFVAFDSKTTTIAENAGKEVKIPVSMVASKCYDATVYFTIDASAYEETGTAAQEGVNFRIKNETNSLTFVEDGDLTQYIIIEPIDNEIFNENGDMCFDIVLSFDEATRCKCHGDGEVHVNLGAYYTTTIVLSDDDHPLKAAGILGSYTGSGPSLFSNESGLVLTWSCEITSDPLDINGVYISQLFPNESGVVYTPIYGLVSADKNSITIGGGQAIGDYGGVYDLSLDFNGPTVAVATRADGGFLINSFVGAKAFQDGTEIGYLFAIGPVTLTKVED